MVGESRQKGMGGLGGIRVSGSFAPLRMTARASNGNGNDNDKSNDNGKIQGSFAPLRMTARTGNGKHRSFGCARCASLRMTVFLGWVGRRAPGGFGA
jgi:hypothetical protein